MKIIFVKLQRKQGVMGNCRSEKCTPPRSQQRNNEWSTQLPVRKRLLLLIIFIQCLGKYSTASPVAHTMLYSDEVEDRRPLALINPDSFRFGLFTLLLE